jgi:hypothetical protein
MGDAPVRALVREVLQSVVLLVITGASMGTFLGLAMLVIRVAR